jgi:carbohydrate-binding DOMON domain-containing protein
MCAIVTIAQPGEVFEQAIGFYTNRFRRSPRALPATATATATVTATATATVTATVTVTVTVTVTEAAHAGSRRAVEPLSGPRLELEDLAKLRFAFGAALRFAARASEARP